MSIFHETIVLERRFEATPAQVFAAYADPRIREVWTAPSDDTAVTIETSDFRTGGAEVGRCGKPGAMNWVMKVTYHRVESDRLICFTEELWDGDALLTVALITFDIQPDGAGARLALTDQVTSFVGEGGASGHRDGYEQALDNLEGLLRRH